MSPPPALGDHDTHSPLVNYADCIEPNVVAEYYLGSFADKLHVFILRIGTERHSDLPIPKCDVLFCRSY